jgi:uncharacterized protein YjiS (DUF1127 family)
MSRHEALAPSDREAPQAVAAAPLVLTSRAGRVSLSRRLRHLLGAIWQHRWRRPMPRLEDLNDHLLRDIGLEPDELPCGTLQRRARAAARRSLQDG